MRCHTATIQGNIKDMGDFNALPDMFIAHCGLNTCEIPENKSVKFPNPGSQFVVSEKYELTAPNGDCGAAGPEVPDSKQSPDPGVPPSSHTTLQTPVAEPSKAGLELLGVPATTTPGQTTPLPPPPEESLAQQPGPEGACSDGETQCGNGDWFQCDHGKWVNMGKWQTGFDCSAK